MKKNLLLALVCVNVFSIFLFPTSYAGNRPGALTVTLGGGYLFFDTKRHIDNKAAGMIEVGYDLTEHWGIEGMLAGFNTKFKKSVDDDRKINGTIFNFNGVYHFNSYSMFEPYVLAGVGIMGLNPNHLDANNEGNINAGVGAQMFVHHSVALRLEARDLYTWVGGKNDVFIGGGISVLVDMC
ncbi:MAG: porin family protein [Gammaproteobacteria bacterium]|nr:porin family protein [Gammaproteobacteria bacterium]MCW5584093.1 porin family protein [Gammaproteobacteria bacterium]